ncbi:hypothetical protein LTR84_003339 [Exophiala bonariae]|uniref:Anaphase-promoting complex subunit 4 WD40 domain-containing protein n=1 Tax=Exophiala bonariae TaxID=1690606 RepID=A0AAV9N6K9_9EURO|nr:hypothetical protein LTR84_003339 [Exophiala bonariae]
MDIHRCRFVPYPPQPINYLAFSHPSDPKQKSPSDLRLAVGRNNGDIEIWNPLHGNWTQDIILKDAPNSAIEQIAWTQDVISPTESGPLRLFSTGGSTSVVEWNLETGVPKRKVEGNLGDIWCFAAQPQQQPYSPNENAASSQLLAAGCNNGSIVLFTTEDDDLRYIQALPPPPTKKPRVLTITWRDRNTIVAGYDDSMIRVIDVPTRTITRHMSLGKPVDGNDTIVWTVKCLPNGTIISGDSSGELKIWDPQNYSLLQRLRSHDADILAVTTNFAGDMIFSLGVDRRTVTYKPVETNSSKRITSWAAISHRRYHRHDIKCATAFERTDMSVLVSGGMDATPIVTPIKRSQSEKHLTLSHLPQKPQISASTRSRLFISWWDNVIAVYHISRRRTPEQNFFDSEQFEAEDSSYEPLTKVVLKGNHAIQDAQIANNGQLIIVITNDQVKLFQLRKTTVTGKPAIRTRQIELPSFITRLGGRLGGFTPDGKWLYIVRNDNAIVLLKILLSSDPRQPPTAHLKSTKLYRPSQPQPSTALGDHHRIITQVSFSSDSRILAVGDLSGAINTWILEGHEDVDFVETISNRSDKSSGASSDASSDEEEEDDDDIAPVVHGQKWIRNPSGPSLPQLDSAILMLTFRPSLPGSPSQSTSTNLGLHATRRNPHPVSQEFPTTDVKLVALTANHQLTEFEVMSNRLSDWTRRNPSRYLPSSFTRLKDRVMGSFWDVTDRRNRGERLWLYSHNYLFMFDMSRDLPRVIYHGNETHKTPRTANSKDGNKTTLGKYQVLDPIANGVQQSPSKTRSEKRSQSQSEDKAVQSTVGVKKRRRSRPFHKSSGAGDPIITAERPGGFGSNVVKFQNNSDDEETFDIDTAMDEADNNTDDVDMGDYEENDALVIMRRGEIEAGHDTNGADNESSNPKPSIRRPHHYLTTEYTSILGIAVIGPDNSESMTTTDPSPEHPTNGLTTSQNNNNGLELVIVERPMYDVEQVPRFDSTQNWDT